MDRRQSLRLFRFLIVVAISVSLAPLYAFGQRNAEPILWERVNVGKRDLFYGPGGRSNLPDLSQVTLIREEKGGYSKKYRIRDADGRIWVAKVGKESQSETAAVRLIHGLGYKTEVNYLVPRLTIPGKGTFTNVRLEARPGDVDRGKEWRWEQNPFKGSPPLKGLLMMMAFINNWDLKTNNNVILTENGQKQYVISDLGVSFGKTGLHPFPLFRWIGRSRNDPEDYARSRFITSVKGNEVNVKYNGKKAGLMDNFTVADARWLANLLNQLSERQIRDAFRAANYTPDEIDTLTRAVQNRIAQLNGASRDRRIAGVR
jgi:hypothetical protein